MQGTRRSFDGALPQLKYLNSSRACSVFLRAPGCMIYLDDVTSDGVEKLLARGVQPRAVIETSPGSHQVWLRVPPGVAAHELYLGAELAIGADPGARPSPTGAGRLGRLPGFRNTKPSRGGWVLLRASTTRPVSPESESALRSLAASASNESITRAAARAAPAESRHASPPRAPDAGEDLSRADMRVAVRLAHQGADEEKIAAALLALPATGRKGPHATDYATRTARKAVIWVRSQIRGA